ncbi:MAG: response regulator transcription factor [Armatimonadota bacterium]
MSAYILIADDDHTLAQAVSWYLEAEGFRVTLAETGPAALAAFRAGRPAAIILDIMMPGMDGFDLCRLVRQESDVPILMLSARDGEADKVRSLGLGADDYVTKPFGAMELVARVKALLRRAGIAAGEHFRAGALEVAPGERQARVAGEAVGLTTLEFDLLLVLLRRPRVVLSRNQLADLVWGGDFSGDLRLVDSHIYHLREKLAAAGLSPCPIATVRGVSYAFRPEK